MALAFCPCDRVTIVLEGFVCWYEEVVHILHRTEIEVELHRFVLQCPIHNLTMVIGHGSGIYRLIVDRRVNLIGDKYNSIAAYI